MLFHLYTHYINDDALSVHVSSTTATTMSSYCIVVVCVCVFSLSLPSPDSTFISVVYEYKISDGIAHVSDVLYVLSDACMNQSI